MTGKVVALEEALTVADEKLREMSERENELKQQNEQSEDNSQKVRQIKKSSTCYTKTVL